MVELEAFIKYRFLPVALVFVALSLFVFYILDRCKETQASIKVASKKKAKGFVFGKVGNRFCFSPLNEEGHIFCAGSTGTGKTKFFLQPSINSMKDCVYSGLVLDFSGDITDKVQAPNKVVFEPESKATIPYNVFYSIDKKNSAEEQTEALMLLAEMMIPIKADMSDASRYYATEAKKILKAALIAFYFQDMDFCEIAEKVVFCGYKELFKTIDATQNRIAIGLISGFWGTTENSINNAKQVADGVLEEFAMNPKYKNAVRRPKEGETSCYAESIAESNLYAKVDDSVKEVYAPLLSLMVMQCMNFISALPNYSGNKIIIWLDEYATLARLGNTDLIVQALEKSRKKGVRIVILTQGFQNIDLVQGERERMVMLNNFKYRVLLGTNSVEEQEYYARMVGKKKATKKSISRSMRQVTRTESEEEEWIIPPAEFGRLKNRLILVHPDGSTFLKKNKGAAKQ